MRKFNVTGLCVPEEDYMVDIGDKIEQIKELVDNRCYFTINRARQYGKTTTLACLEDALQDRYLVISISFEGLGDESFESPKAFCLVFMELIQQILRFTDEPDEYLKSWLDKDVVDFNGLSQHITKMCRSKKIVLMIDEVDKTSNNRIFLHFLGTLRNKFMARKRGKDYTFHSVILAGVYDIKNIKLKMLREGNYIPTPEENKLYNSPWNIAANFKVDMSFNSTEISTMLAEYEAEHNTGMNIVSISAEIYNYTSGYPFLVSRICQCIDEEISKDWTSIGVQNAVKIILKEENTLFDDLFKNLENSEKLYSLIYDVLIVGKRRTFATSSPTVKLGSMYGIIKESGQSVIISNKIFEIVICNYFISKDEEEETRQITNVLQYDIVSNGRFDMELCLRKFAGHYAELFSRRDEFLEKHGRLLFLSYLKPLINGQGFYHIESQFTDLRRMDVMVDYGHDQFIIELKIWHGEKYKEDAYQQLLGYMDSKNADTGYLLTFDFRKDANKQPCAKWVDFGGKRIFDVVV